ncbi:nuclear pore complex protein nup98a [Phtheirospermum japonicum]|uniref:Nuclear pore complex protein nup98a n=1 Tax=Phtheirospermum japonicum TaxID=374723 RepID=A0A830B514_9LAMI|nr:nuclear pore complex protein nup98a [Phtheirospermum japonicum]
MIESQGATKLKPTTGSRLSPYSTTRIVVEVDGKKCTERFQSISAMPVYEAKSHEELRLEDYELLPNKASIGLKVANEVGHPYINGQQQQQYVPASTVSAQSSLAVDPFPTRSEIDRPNAAVLTSVQHGISSLPAVPNKLSSNRSTSLMRIRHVSSRLNSLQPHQRYTTPSSEPKVAFFHNEVDRPGPFLPRENPRAWVTNSLPSLQSSSDGKCCEDRDLPSSSFQLNTHIQEETEHLSATSISHQNDDDDSVIIAKKHEASVLSLMPKLPNGNGYYTKPLLNELAAKEMDEPGSLSRVNDFVVGKSGYGSIKFLGETDIRHLDLGSVVQFNNREVIVYADEKTKPAVGKGVNKPAEVTLLNVKCVSNKTGKQYVDGPQVQSYKEMLMKKALEQGAEHVSYDPVRGEWKFRVQHF